MLRNKGSTNQERDEGCGSDHERVELLREAGKQQTTSPLNPQSLLHSRDEAFAVLRGPDGDLYELPGM